MSDAGSAPDRVSAAEPGSPTPMPRKGRRRKRVRRKIREKNTNPKPQAEQQQTTPQAEPEPLAGQSPAEESHRKPNPSRSRSDARDGNTRNNANSNEGPVYGALDLGTNNCRLLIARRTREGFRVVDAYSRIVRLGEGLSARGALSEEAMTRAIEALKICADKMERRGVTRSRLIATEACRAASNGAEFIARVKEQAGLALEVVSNEDEARLAVAGCSPLLDHGCRSALVFDIGGGSTELIWVSMGGERAASGSQNGKKPKIEDWISLPCGVVTLSEGHGGVDVSHNVYERMVAEVAARVEPFVARLSAARAGLGGGFHLLGTSGTVTTIAGVHLGLARYDRTQVDGIWITPDNVQVVTRSLLSMSYADRAAHPCVGRERADLVLAGCAIFEAIARAWPAERLRVADRGLREGILLSLMEADSGRTRRRRRRRGGKSAARAQGTKQ
ncbi:MAG: Ppx/GppA phosphatase family protein [Parvibaculaceae bacterium]